MDLNERIKESRKLKEIVLEILTKLPTDKVHDSIKLFEMVERSIVKQISYHELKYYKDTCKEFYDKIEDNSDSIDVDFLDFKGNNISNILIEYNDEIYSLAEGVVGFIYNDLDQYVHLITFDIFDSEGYDQIAVLFHTPIPT